jgi:serine O-acetyltransferase
MTTIKGNLRADFNRYYAYSNGGRLGRIMQCLLLPGLQTIAVYRFGRWAKRQPLLLRMVADPLYFILNGFIKVLWGIELQRGAKIGPGLYIGHFGGITVSGDAVLGRNCSISQNTTIGVSGQGAKQGVPVIGDNVYIAVGARLFGKIRIGDNVKIGANAVIYSDIPDNAIVVLDPGFKIISYKGNQVAADV